MKFFASFGFFDTWSDSRHFVRIVFISVLILLTGVPVPRWAEGLWKEMLIMSFDGARVSKCGPGVVAPDI